MQYSFYNSNWIPVGIKAPAEELVINLRVLHDCNVFNGILVVVKICFGKRNKKIKQTYGRKIHFQKMRAIYRVAITQRTHSDLYREILTKPVSWKRQWGRARVYFIPWSHTSKIEIWFVCQIFAMLSFHFLPVAVKFHWSKLKKGEPIDTASGPLPPGGYGKTWKWIDTAYARNNYNSAQWES